MTITIPIWFLWAIGCAVVIPLILVVLFFAYMGFMFLNAFNSKGRWGWW